MSDEEIADIMLLAADEIEQLRAENAKLCAALEWYGNPSNWWSDDEIGSAFDLVLKNAAPGIAADMRLTIINQTLLRLELERRAALTNEQEVDGVERLHETMGRRLEAKDKEITKLRATLEEFADTEHHQSPVPLWIRMKAHAALNEETK